MKNPDLSRPVRALLFCFLLLPVSATVAGGVGYVDARRLIQEAPQGQAAASQLEEEFAERGREIKGRFDLFKAKEEEIQKNRLLMSPTELEEKTDELRKMQRQLKRDEQEFNEDLATSRNEGLAKLERLISEVIIEVAKREELDIVFQEAVYASPDIDLTGRVLDELQKLYEK